MSARYGLSPSHIGLESHGLEKTGNQYWNLSTAALVEESIRRGEGLLEASGALVVKTGDRTGRSPKDKFVVHEPASADEIWWGKVNVATTEQRFDAIHARMIDYIKDREVFVQDCWAGAHPKYRVPIRTVHEFAWHSLFGRQLFVRATPEETAQHVPEYTVLYFPNFKADPKRDGTNSEVFIKINLDKGMILIGGTEYGGEMKKSIFSILNYLLPKRGILSMHCAANQGVDGDTALFFGLSGTGKTTLSADPARRLIGDDEHGWCDEGIFNFEGGCYAKTIKLSRKNEPQIWNAIRFGSVVENVVMDPYTRIVDYNDDSVTENTRAAYPIDFIDNAVIPGIGGHPKDILFLTCDAFGVLPPVSKLTTEQAMYHFLAGYTAKVAGTETGITEPETTFSACFGSPFLPLPPNIYARLLGERIKKHDSHCWLVNTGWSGGPYGVGERMNLPYTRALVTAILDGSLAKIETSPDPIFGVHVPKSCPGVPEEILTPELTWADKARYHSTAKHLAQEFMANEAKMGEVSPEILAAGPKA